MQVVLPLSICAWRTQPVSVCIYLDGQCAGGMTRRGDTYCDTDISHFRQSVLLFGAHVLEDGFGSECRGSLSSSLNTV